MGELLDRYDGVAEVLEEVTVITPPTGRLHRAGEEGEPWCGSGASTEAVNTDQALAFGCSLCQNCYRAVFAHLSRMESSPVEDVSGVSRPSPDVTLDVDGQRAKHRLDSLTAEVVVGTSGADTFHAPASDELGLCGEEVSGTRRPVHQTPPSARPCRRCFTVDVVEEYAGRDADLLSAYETATDGGEP